MNKEDILQDLEILETEFKNTFKISFLLEGPIEENTLEKLRRDLHVLLRKIDIIKNKLEDNYDKDIIKKDMTDLYNTYEIVDTTMAKIINIVLDRKNI